MKFIFFEALMAQLVMSEVLVGWAVVPIPGGVNESVVFPREKNRDERWREMGHRTWLR